MKKNEAKVKARINDKKILALQGEWTEPISLDATSQLPAFPVEALPETGREMVQMVTDVNQVDAGLTGTCYLAVLSTCLAKHAVVDLGTHTEPLNIYVCSILPSGERKSATLNIMSNPLVRLPIPVKSTICSA